MWSHLPVEHGAQILRGIHPPAKLVGKPYLPAIDIPLELPRVTRTAGAKAPAQVMEVRSSGLSRPPADFHALRRGIYPPAEDRARILQGIHPPAKLVGKPYLP
ncbi:MAG: hypothetical protein ABWK53_05830, partial [Anaerolineales bacterium]